MNSLSPEYFDGHKKEDEEDDEKRGKLHRSWLLLSDDGLRQTGLNSVATVHFSQNWFQHMCAQELGVIISAYMQCIVSSDFGNGFKQTNLLNI